MIRGVRAKGYLATSRREAQSFEHETTVHLLAGACPRNQPIPEAGQRRDFCRRAVHVDVAECNMARRKFRQLLRNRTLDDPDILPFQKVRP